MRHSTPYKIFLRNLYDFGIVFKSRSYNKQKFLNEIYYITHGESSHEGYNIVTPNTSVFLKIFFPDDVYNISSFYLTLHKDDGALFHNVNYWKHSLFYVHEIIVNDKLKGITAYQNLLSYFNDYSMYSGTTICSKYEYYVSLFKK